MGRRNKNVYFMPLGGGQEVGASCYYLRLGDNNILLDAGVGNSGGLKFEPNTNNLVRSPFVQSLSEISKVFISHAHMDHMGFLPKIAKEAGQASFYMTELTYNFVNLQLTKKLQVNDFMRQTINDRAIKVGYMQEIRFNDYSVTFFPAGHIPGAFMVLFDFNGKKILYTGDYSLNEAPLAHGCFIPENMGIDTIILCALHAKHPNYRHDSDRLFKLAANALHCAMIKNKAVIHTTQLTKGIEILKVLNNLNEIQKLNLNIYVEDEIWHAGEELEKAGIPVFTRFNHPLTGRIPLKRHIFLASSNKYLRRYESYFKADFSLHEDFDEMKEFIKRVNPKQAILVHCGKQQKEDGITVETEIMMDPDCKTNFIFAENGEIYKLF